MNELTSEQREIQQWARDFARRQIAPRALILDKDPDSPQREELLREAANAGVIGAGLPEFLGGSGHDPFLVALTTEEFAVACAGCTTLFGATLLGLSPILLCGDPAPIMKFVPPLAESWKTGTPKLAALAATEPDTGSDFIFGHPEGRVRTHAVREDGGYRINGRKVFISNGSIAGLVTVFASDGSGNSIREGMNCFVVTAGTPGFFVGQVFEKMGQRACPAAELVFEDVRVPEDHRLGPEGKAWTLNRTIMAVTRMPVAAIALGIARAAYEKALEYAGVRIQGGRPIVRHQAIQLLLADMATRVEAARGLVWKAARAIAALEPSLTLSSMAKVFASDAAVANATDAIQILGGYGYMHEYGVEKLLRDAKLTQIYEGTNQINRFEIMEGAGVKVG